MLLCWCIGKAASSIDEFYLLPEKGCLYRYDRLAVNVIVDNIRGGINNCDIPYSDSMEQFAHDYDTLTKETQASCKDVADEDAVIIGTSAVIGTELDAIVNQYTGIFNNPFLAWGRYRHHWFKTTLTISMQFHHAQMDGREATRFLETLQKAIRELSV
jgi:chloramphenicol O-acetyltransferase type A